MMDCGAGWTGKLAIMNIDTNEHWLSAIQDPAIEKPDMKKIYKKLGGN